MVYSQFYSFLTMFVNYLDSCDFTDHKICTDTYGHWCVQYLYQNSFVMLTFFWFKYSLSLLLDGWKYASIYYDFDIEFDIQSHKITRDRHVWKCQWYSLAHQNFKLQHSIETNKMIKWNTCEYHITSGCCAIEGVGCCCCIYPTTFFLLIWLLKIEILKKITKIITA